LLVLVLATLAAYQPAWHGGLLWDDDDHLTRRALQSTAGLWRIWSDPAATPQYYPIAHSAFWAMHRLWGEATTGYHLVNILLHAVSAFLFARILRRLRVPGATLAAVFFALHPVQVESVAWMTELKNTLSGACYFGAALAYLRYDAERRSRWYGLALGLFVLALLSKSVTATLPAALLVVFWWQRGRIDWRRDVAPLSPFFAIGIASGLFTAWVERTIIGAQGAEFTLTAIERVLLAGRALWFYLYNVIRPGATFIYPRWDISQGVWWQYFFPVAAVAVAVGAWRRRRHSRTPLAVLLLFAGTLFPALGFFNVYPFRYSYVADHFQYLASAPLFAWVAAWAVGVAQRSNPTPGRLAALPVMLGALLGLVTWMHARDFTDAETLYQSTLRRNRSCWMCHANLGQMYLRASPPDLTRAVSHVQSALRINPLNPEAHTNLGVAYELMGDYDAALLSHREALRLKPDSPEAVNNLGVVLQRQGKLDNAIAQYREALRLAPEHAQAHHNLGSALLAKGRVEEALVHIHEALRISPGYVEARLNLAAALQRQGRWADAITQYEEVIRRQPSSVAAHNDLGTVLEAQGRVEEAISHYTEAVARDPNAALALTNLGRALLRLGRRDEAIARFESALRVRPDDPGGAHYHLANTLREMGRLEEAVTHYTKALESTPPTAHAMVHNDLGVTLATLGRRAEAIAQFDAALRIAPGFTAARENRARAQAQRVKGRP
jgi:tetratricopeptide (TPR) repeat protein